VDRIGKTLIVIGILALAYTASVWVQAEAHQAYQRRAFDESLAEMRAGDTPSTTPGMNGVIGRLDIPSVSLSVMVLEGTGESELRLGAGHVPGTALPGKAGNVGIAGHRDTFFRPLRKIQPGDGITLTTHKGTFRYAVEATWITRPEDTAVLEADSEAVLTLVTCHPFSYIGPAPDRFIVRARMLGGVGVRE
jgi:sortase A